MPVKIIDTLKPKNGGSFPIVEAIDVFVENYGNLAEAVSHFATDVMIEAINAVLSDKANTSDVNTAVSGLQAQIDQIAQAAGTGSADTEVAQARVDADGTTYNTLKARLDADVDATNAKFDNLGINLDDDNSLLEQYGYINASGQYKSTDDPNHYYTGYIDIANTVSVAIKTVLRYAYIAWYRSDHSFISSVGDAYSQGVGVYTLTPPDGARYIRVSCYSGSGTSFFYIRYSYNLTANIVELESNVSNLIESVEEFETGITPKMTTFISGGDLDLDGNIALEDEYTKNAYLDNGQIISNQYTSLYCCTGFIEVESETVYTAKGFESGNTITTYAVAQYTADKSYISTTSNNVKFTTAANCKYVIVCLKGGSSCPNIGTGILVVKKGTSAPSEYIPPTYLPLELENSDYVKKNEILISPEMTTFITGGEFDTDGNICTEENYTKDAYLNPDTGAIEHNAYTSKYCCTDYMEVAPETSYVTQVYDDNSSVPYAIAQYAADKTFIKIDVNSSRAITTANCKYVVACYRGNACPDIGTGIIVFKKGVTAPDSYEAPRDKPYELVGSDYVTENEIAELITESAVKLTLPETFHLVVDDKFELFWKGAINCLNPDDYYIEVTCSKGKSYRRNYEYTPALSDIGSYTMNVQLYNQDRKKLDEKDVTLIVENKATNPINNKVLCYVGDSLTNNGYVPDEFNKRMLDDECTNITFIGDKSSTRNSIKYVGSGGWTWASYNSSMKSNAYMWITTSHDKTVSDQHSIYSDGTNHWKLETIETNTIKIIRTSGTGALPSTGTLTWVSGGEHNSDIVYSSSEQASGNPFWNDDTDSFDIAGFVESQGESSLDYIYILLGWNSISDTKVALKSQVNTFINNVLADYPNCKIILLGLEVPAFDGLAENYGTNSGALSSFYQSMNHVWRLNELYAEIASENTNVFFANVAAQFDTEYNMPTAQRNVNARNSTKITFQRNGVHPEVSGYYQIADVCYRDFTHRLQE